MRTRTALSIPLFDWLKCNKNISIFCMQLFNRKSWHFLSIEGVVSAIIHIHIFKFWQFLVSINVAHNLFTYSLNCRNEISNIYCADDSDIFEDKKIQKKSFLQIFGVFNIFFFEKIRKSYLKAIFPLFFVSKNSSWCLKSISIHGKMLLYYKWRVSYN